MDHDQEKTEVTRAGRDKGASLYSSARSGALTGLLGATLCHQGRQQGRVAAT